MIANVKEFEKKLIDNDLNRKLMAKKMNMAPATLTAKLEKPDSSFRLSEMVTAAQITNMNENEFMYIFFGENLSLNESSRRTSENMKAV